jgi:tRNA (guanine37-N1)-methyltransferase
MRFEILTLFPEVYEVLNSGIIGKAIAKNLFEVNVTNIRDFSTDKHKKCDAYPFGGGAGMVMTPEPVHNAIKARDGEHKCERIYVSPKGQTLTQSLVKELSCEDNILILTGSYEGIDQRVIDLDIDMEVSIGEYVFTSGYLPALVILKAVARYVPDVLGSEQSTSEESFSENLLEYPQYTRPQNFLGLEVPEVLISGNHQLVDAWRREQSQKITKERRPDLLKK